MLLARIQARLRRAPAGIAMTSAPSGAALRQPERPAGGILSTGDLSLDRDAHTAPAPAER